MKKYYIGITLFILLSFLGGTWRLAAQSEHEDGKIEALDRSRESTPISKSEEVLAEQEQIEEVKETVDEAKIEAETAKKEAAELAEEKLRLAEERAILAESEIKKQQNIMYRKFFQTGLAVVIGYLLIFIIVSIINRRIEDLKVKHIARKNAVYLINFTIILAIIYIWIHNISSITIFISAISVGVALALQEVILSEL